MEFNNRSGNYKDHETSTNSHDNYDQYGDGDLPEIDTSKSKATATNVIPDEVPRRDGPGGN